MTIWKKQIDIKKFSGLNNTMPSHLGIELTELGHDFLKAKMPVDFRTRQPMGLLHGGASCVLAETIGSVASFLVVDDLHHCVGLDITTNHISKVRDGFVYATATPIHLGSKIHIWNIPIHDEEGRLVSLTRLTMIVLNGPTNLKESE